jgi:cytochrome P450
VRRDRALSAAAGLVWTGRSTVERAMISWPERLFDRNSVSAMGPLRRRRPIARLGRTVLVTRWADATAVLADGETFPASYSEGLAGGSVLGQLGGRRAAVRQLLIDELKQEDLEGLERLAAEGAAARVADSSGRLAVGRELVRPTLLDSVATYVGVESDQPERLVWLARAAFQAIFLNPLGLATVRDEGRLAVALWDQEVRRVLRRRGDGLEGSDDLATRLLLQHRSGRLTEQEVVDNLVALAIGWLVHGAKAAMVALDTLLSRPEELSAASGAAQEGDVERLRGILWEVLRFRPVQVGVLRRCEDSAVLAGGAPRETTIRGGDSLLVCTHAAMWDEELRPEPERFDAGTDGRHLHFGWGEHRCLGEAIMGRQLPAMLMPLLALDTLERAGAGGKLSWAGFSPDELHVQFDPR